MEFLKFLFTLLLLLDIFFTAASFVFSYILLRRGKNQVNFNFGMSVLFMAVWMLVTLLDFFRFTPFSSTFHAILGFTISIWVLHFFLLFTYNFPTPKQINNLKVVFLYVLTFVVSITTFLPGLYATSGSVDFPFRYRVINPVGLTIFTLYFAALAAISFLNLFNNYEKADGLHRIQLKKIIAGSAAAVVVNLIVSLINYYYTTFDLTVIGMFFTFTALLYMYSILFSKNLKQF